MKLKSGELNDGHVKYSEEKITEEAVNKSSAKIFPRGSLLIAMYGATAGRLGILDINSSTNQAICAIFPREEILNQYVFYNLFFQRSQLLKSRIGGAQPNINHTIINALSIPLPPLNEQYRIVAKIEELFTELDAGVATLKALQKQVKQYRQSVLKSAFEGKLTEQWRKKNADKLEPASKLGQVPFLVEKV